MNTEKLQLIASTAWELIGIEGFGPLAKWDPTTNTYIYCTCTVLYDKRVAGSKQIIFNPTHSQHARCVHISSLFFYPVAIPILFIFVLLGVCVRVVLINYVHHNAHHTHLLPCSALAALHM